MLTELATASLHFVGECPDAAHCDYVHKTLGLLSDGPHITAELVVDLVENAVLFAIAWVVGRRALRREHLKQDVEHGISHHDADCNLR